MFQVTYWTHDDPTRSRCIDLFPADPRFPMVCIWTQVEFAAEAWDVTVDPEGFTIVPQPPEIVEPCEMASEIIDVVVADSPIATALIDAILAFIVATTPHQDALYAGLSHPQHA